MRKPRSTDELLLWVLMTIAIELALIIGFMVVAFVVVPPT